MTCRALLIVPLLLLAGCAGQSGRCPAAGQWLAPSQASVIPDPLPASARKPVILLGEHHDRAADHRWQLASIEAVLAQNPNLALGFEMFPRSAQPVLDAWTEGRLGEAAFLLQVDWAHAWGGDPELYMPIFRFARDYRIRMLALNVPRALTRQVAKGGWASVAPGDRQGLGDPAPPSPAYRARLTEALGGHEPGSGMNADYFIEAQLVWDRAMAEAIATAHAAEPRRTILAIMGSGHLERREGVPHQLAALGLEDAAVFLPIDPAEGCDAAEPGLADALYIAAD